MVFEPANHSEGAAHVLSNSKAPRFEGSVLTAQTLTRVWLWSIDITLSGRTFRIGVKNDVPAVNPAGIDTFHE